MVLLDRYKPENHGLQGRKLTRQSMVWKKQVTYGMSNTYYPTNEDNKVSMVDGNHQLHPILNPLTVTRYGAFDKSKQADTATPRQNDS